MSPKKIQLNWLTALEVTPNFCHAQWAGLVEPSSLTESPFPPVSSQSLYRGRGINQVPWSSLHLLQLLIIQTFEGC